ncbi:NAD-dependent epimerase/dehydratase family protein [Allokutzneria oryzae]|uniref:NAD-dependent epimerase/dehydratase family protein n=1 Tax=Allokutzneria oryzae TaxID=1378989 RepID=A0ABV6A7E9_9PSEU
MNGDSARVLLTGASGVIGSRLLPVLAARHRVTALTRQRAVPEAVRCVAADVRVPGLGLDHDTWRRLREETDIVVHCAGVSGFTLSNLDMFKEINVWGTRNVLDLAAEAAVPVVMMSSTSAAQDYTDDDPTSRALRAYADSKRRAEQLAAACPEPVAMIRTALLLVGSNDGAADPRQQFPPVLLEALLRGRVRRLPVTSGHWFDAIRVETLVRYTAAVVEAMLDVPGAVPSLHWATAGPARLTMADVMAACSTVAAAAGLPFRHPELQPSAEPRRGLERLVQLGLFAPDAPPFPSTLGSVAGGPVPPQRSELLSALEANTSLVSQWLSAAVTR